MEERDEKRGGWGCAIGLVLLLLVLLPVVYILSTGPFEWLVGRGYLSMDTAEAISGILYAPLRLMTKRCEPLLDFVLWWDQLFYP